MDNSHNAENNSEIKVVESENKSGTKEVGSEKKSEAIAVEKAAVQQADVKNKKDSEKQQNTKPKMVTCKIGLLMGFGAAGVVFGALATIFWPPIFMGQLRSMMALTNESMSFDIWREVPIPMYLECFFWNVTNVAQILDGTDTKLKVEQVGPYVYREQHTKVGLEWNENSTVTYYNQRYWYYEPEMSNGSLSDVITSINPIVATVAYSVRDWNRILRIGANLMMVALHENMFLKANVSSWLFDGIHDPIISAASHLPIPLVIPYDKFGWFYERNGSKEFDGVFVMNTGVEDFSRLGMVQMWKNSNRTLYRGECGEVRGSTGELWAPESGQPEVEVFSPDLCTHMTLAKNRTVRVQGIDGVEYAANYSLFDNGHKYPRMACYCAETRDADCLPVGALNVSECRYGAPAFVSLPHFLHSDPHYPSKIDGLEPTEEHNFRLALEMFTGMPLQVHAQLQINLLVRHVDSVTINNRLPDPDVLVPMFWFRQEVRLTEEYASLARFALNMRYKIPIAFYGITAIGLALVLTGILIRKTERPPETSILEAIGLGLALAGIIILVRRITRDPETTPILEESSSQDELIQ